EWPHGKSRPEHEQTQDECGGRVECRREEVLAEKDREHAVDVEVVPLDERADRGGADDEGQVHALLVPARCLCRDCHGRFPCALLMRFQFAAADRRTRTPSAPLAAILCGYITSMPTRTHLRLWSKPRVAATCPAGRVRATDVRTRAVPGLCDGTRDPCGDCG